MNTLETVPETQTSVNPIKQLLTHLIEQPPNENRDELWEQAENAWEIYPELELTQDDVTGKFRRESLAYCLGSLRSYSIFIDLSTDDGPQSIQLRMNGVEPAFDIRPAVKANNLLVEPRHASYAEMPIQEAFDWTSMINSVRSSRSLDDDSLYLVVFRSKLKPGADIDTLLEHDKKAHDAALASPALIHYFPGNPNELGQALSFCLWEDAESAKEISKDTRHIAAKKMVTSYESYSIEKYDVHYTNSEVFLVPRSN